MKKIGIISITIIFLIGIFIMPINAAIIPEPNYNFAVQNNLLSADHITTENCSVSYDESSGILTIVSSGNGLPFKAHLASGPYSLSLNTGNYRFGFANSGSQTRLLTLYYNQGAESISLSTSSASSFSLNYPSVCSLTIASRGLSSTDLSTSVTFKVRPYLIYDNNSINSITSAFSSVIYAPFSAIASGFNSLSDQIIGVDNLITPFGTVLVFIISIPLIVWGLNTLIGFITRPFKRR